MDSTLNFLKDAGYSYRFAGENLWPGFPNAPSGG
jgi:hypothetical protein